MVIKPTTYICASDFDQVLAKISLSHDQKMMIELDRLAISLDGNYVHDLYRINDDRDYFKVQHLNINDNPKDIQTILIRVLDQLPKYQQFLGHFYLKKGN